MWPKWPPPPNPWLIRPFGFLANYQMAKRRQSQPAQKLWLAFVLLTFVECPWYDEHCVRHWGQELPPWKPVENSECTQKNREDFAGPWVETWRSPFAKCMSKGRLFSLPCKPPAFWTWVLVDSFPSLYKMILSSLEHEGSSSSLSLPEQILRNVWLSDFSVAFYCVCHKMEPRPANLADENQVAKAEKSPGKPECGITKGCGRMQRVRKEQKKSDQRLTLQSFLHPRTWGVQRWWGNITLHKINNH